MLNICKESSTGLVYAKPCKLDDVSCPSMRKGARVDNRQMTGRERPSGRRSDIKRNEASEHQQGGVITER